MKTIVTHNGKFHADDVFAIATFLLAHEGEEWQVLRSRDGEVVSKADASVDVGDVYDPSSKRFDHHQKGGAGVRENGIPFASFGLVWKEYGALVCSGDFFVTKQIDDHLVCAIDANDNGVKIYEETHLVSPFEISAYIAVQNLTWKEEQVLLDKSDEQRLKIFLKLVDWAKEFILREVKRSKDKNDAFVLVEKCYEDALDKELIVLDQFMPWKDALLNHAEPKLVVFPNEAGRWSVHTIPVAKNSFESRLDLPQEWAGKRDLELESVSGVAGAVFCHNARFLAVANSKDGAIALAKIALSISNIK